MQMLASEVMKTYKTYLDHCNARRFHALDEFLHEIIILNGHAITLKHFQERLVTLIETVPDYRWEMVDAVVSNSRVAVQIEASGTPCREWLGVAPTGKSVCVKEMVFYSFRDRKISDISVLFDIAALRDQLGATDRV